jgi:two-component system, cell cycle response regulator DivK
MPKILLVEDDPMNAEIMTRFLRIKKYEVFCASDGPACVRLAQVERPDLILMDMLLPNQGDGQQATREIRAQADMKAIPIVALTAQSMPEEVREMYEAGCTDVVTKPINFDHLLRRIATLLTAGAAT